MYGGLQWPIQTFRLGRGGGGGGHPDPEIRGGPVSKKFLSGKFLQLFSFYQTASSCLSNLQGLMQNDSFVCLLQCIETSQASPAQHDEEDDVDDFFSTTLQAKWFNNLSQNLCNDVSASWKNDPKAFDPEVVVQRMIDMLREESAAQGKKVEAFYYQSLEDLKRDPDFKQILTEFKEALDGERNMMTIGLLVA